MSEWGALVISEIKRNLPLLLRLLSVWALDLHVEVAGSVLFHIQDILHLGLILLIILDQIIIVKMRLIFIPMHHLGPLLLIAVIWGSAALVPVLLLDVGVLVSLGLLDVSSGVADKVLVLVSYRPITVTVVIRVILLTHERFGLHVRDVPALVQGLLLLELLVVGSVVAFVCLIDGLAHVLVGKDHGLKLWQRSLRHLLGFLRAVSLSLLLLLPAVCSTNFK